jgi:FkbM family methyltransferase
MTKMTIFQIARRIAAVLGVHADRLSRQPVAKMLGLVEYPIDLIIDVGANIGQFAREMRTKFPKAHIVSFEPNISAYQQLKEWADQDGNARAFNVAVGEVNGKAEMHVHLDHHTSSSLLTTTDLKTRLFPLTQRQNTVKVDVRRLDEILEANDIVVGPNAFLKFDVQGYEESAMRGAPRTLSQVRAVMTELFIADMYTGQASFVTLVNLAHEAGLKYNGNYSQVVSADGRIMWLDALFIR